MAIKFAEHDFILLVVGAGGFLLIGIGVNVFRDMEAFEIDWSESEQIAWMSTLLQFILALGVSVAAALFILP